MRHACVTDAPDPQNALGFVVDDEGAITDVDRRIDIRVMLETATLAPENRLDVAILRAGVTAVRALLR